MFTFTEFWIGLTNTVEFKDDVNRITSAKLEGKLHWQSGRPFEPDETWMNFDFDVNEGERQMRMYGGGNIGDKESSKEFETVCQCKFLVGKDRHNHYLSFPMHQLSVRYSCSHESLMPLFHRGICTPTDDRTNLR